MFYRHNNSLAKHFVPYPNDKFLEESRRTCKCGHVVNFVTNIPWIECTYCHDLIFRNKKAEFDYKVKRKVIK